MTGWPYMIIESLSGNDLYYHVGHVHSVPRTGETVEVRDRCYTVHVVLWSFDYDCKDCGEIHQSVNLRVK